MGQAGSTGVKATVPAKTGKTQPRQTADIAVAAKTVKPTARTKGAIQSSTSGKVSTSMSTSARPGGTAASVALKGKTTTVAKSKVTEVESKQTPASASATKTGTARTNTAAKPAKAAAEDTKRTAQAEATPTTPPAPRAEAAAEPKKRGRKPKAETQADDSSTDVTEEFDTPAAPAPKTEKLKARDRKAKEKALLKEFAASQQGGSE